MTKSSKRLVFDVANRVMQLTDGKKISRLVSVKRYLGKNRSLHFADSSRYIRLSEGEEAGKTWVLGNSATAFDDAIKTYAESKPSVCRDFFLALLQDFPNLTTIDELLVIDSLPEQQQDIYRRILERSHTWQCNNKKNQSIQRTVNVQKVTTVQEGQGAVNLLLKSYTPVKPFLVVYNLGAGTFDAVTFTEHGEVQPEYRKNLNGKGAIDLANRLLARLREYQMIQFDVTPEVLFDALENEGILNSHAVASQRDDHDLINIYPVAQEVAKQWLAEKHKQNSAMLRSISSQIDKYILVGGLANLFRGAYDDHPLIMVSPNPDTDNLAALL